MDPREPAGAVTLSAHFRSVFGREPDLAELEKLARCRAALSWRIAPPSRPSRGSRVLARWCQPQP